MHKRTLAGHGSATVAALPSLQAIHIIAIMAIDGTFLKALLAAKHGSRAYVQTMHASILKAGLRQAFL